MTSRTIVPILERLPPNENFAFVLDHRNPDRLQICSLPSSAKYWLQNSHPSNRVYPGRPSILGHNSVFDSRYRPENREVFVDTGKRINLPSVNQRGEIEHSTGNHLEFFEPPESSCLSFRSDDTPMYQTREEVIQKLLHGERGGESGESSSSSDSSPTDPAPLKFRHWTDPDKFAEDNLQEVYEKLTSLEKQIWGKLIVMEGNRRTAKAYLRHPVVTIDGSDAEFDGLRIGLARFQNPKRLSVVYDIFNEILEGVKVKIDPDGNVWAKRMCYSPVFLKPLYRNRPNDLFIIDQRPVKVFDIRRFKEILVQELRQPNPDRARLEKCCMVCLKFSVDHYDLLRTPCWIVVVHLVAVELLNLVMPKASDREMSSPSSSFIAGSPMQNLPPPPPPILEQLNSSETRFERANHMSQMNSSNGYSSPSSTGLSAAGNYGTNSSTPPRTSGLRASRGGVMKRIVQKETSPYSTPPQGPLLGEFELRASTRLPPSGYRSDYESRFNQSGQLHGVPRQVSPGMATSMLDLRQLNKHYSPPYFSNNEESPYAANRPHHQSIPTTMGERVFSLEALNARSDSPHEARRYPPRYIQGENAGVTAQMERQYRLKKWKSQDSGIGSGSYGSK